MIPLNGFLQACAIKIAHELDGIPARKRLEPEKGRTFENAKASASEQHSDQGHDESGLRMVKT
ncbi:hypothetical protein, partial [Slackia isoflavoniconvertens]|uniref:hypothetical protein n=1 Tax=Slackia isoflavoniconvertens TaxID=572010 RepID=UPI003A9713F3